MVKFLVGRGLSFTLDHCEGCKGIWLDRNEWEALKKRNLHDDLNLMFTSFWQTEANRMARKKRSRIFMLADSVRTTMRRLSESVCGLDTKPNREELLAYLIDRDPYAA